MLSQSLATYPLFQCIVAAAEFKSGEIAFYDSYAELTAADAEGNTTSPLRIHYDVLTHFRIVRVQSVMRLTLPRVVVQRWAEQNAFATQLEALENTPVDQTTTTDAAARTTNGTSSNPVCPSLAGAPAAMLLMRLHATDMSHFLQTIAPLVAASRRTRSASRLSVTEPLPVQESFVDPARSMTEVSTPPTQILTQDTEPALETETEGDENVVRHDDPETSEKAAPCADDVPESGSMQERDVQRTTAEKTVVVKAAAGTPKPAHDPPLLGGDEISGSRRSRSRSNSSAGNRNNGHHYSTDRTTSIVSQAPHTAARTVTGKAHPLSSSQLLPDTLENVEGELAELLQETEHPRWHSVHKRGNGTLPQALRRRAARMDADLAVTAAAVGAAGAGQHKKKGRGRDRGVARNSTTAHVAASSVCPSLTSSAKDDQDAAEAPKLHMLGGSSSKDMVTRAAKQAVKKPPARHTTTHLCGSDRASSPASMPGSALRKPDGAQTDTVTGEPITVRPGGILLEGVSAAAVHLLSFSAQTRTAGREVSKEKSHAANARAAQGPLHGRQGNPLSPVPSSATRLGDSRDAPATETKPKNTYSFTVEPSRLASLEIGHAKGDVQQTAEVAPAVPPRSVRFAETAIHQKTELFQCAATQAPRSHGSAKTAPRPDVKAYLLDLFPRYDTPGQAPGRKPKKAPAAARAKTKTLPRPPARASRTKGALQGNQTIAPALAGSPVAGEGGVENVPPSPCEPVEVSRSAEAGMSLHKKRAGSSIDDTAPVKRARLGGDVGCIADTKDTCPPLHVTNAETTRPLPPSDAENLPKANACEAIAHVNDAAAFGLVQSPLIASQPAEVDGAAAYDVRAKVPCAAAYSSDGFEEQKSSAHAAAFPANICTDVLENVAAASLRANQTRGTDTHSNTSSTATCPLFYHRDSRKERMRRCMRYMNVVSRNLAVLHETHDALRGLLLSMMDEHQL